MPPHRPLPALLRRGFALLLLATLAASLASCSVKRYVVKSVANSLTSGPDVYGTDDDPELVKDALPFGLKTLESLLEVVPDHEGLLLALCRGYTSYAFAFVQTPGDLLVNSDYAKSQALHERALKLDLRALGYGLRGLEKRYKGISAQLKYEPFKAASRIQKRDVAKLYWTAAAWGSAIALGKDRAELLADLPAVRSLIERGLQLDEGYEGGAMHEAMIVLDALPPTMGGSESEARAHFAKAVALTHDGRPGPYVTLAQTVCVLKQDRAEFRSLLEKALSFDPNRDPSQRLVTTVLQQKARALLDREDEFFVEGGADSTDTTAPDTSKTQENR